MISRYSNDHDSGMTSILFNCIVIIISLLFNLLPTADEGDVTTTGVMVSLPNKMVEDLASRL